MSAKTLGALAESIGVSAADVGNQAGANWRNLSRIIIVLLQMSSKAQLTTIAGSLKTDAENLGGYAQSVGGQAKNLGTYAGSIGTSLQETQTDLQIVSGCFNPDSESANKDKDIHSTVRSCIKTDRRRNWAVKDII